jgi:hypothetical protein
MSSRQSISGTYGCHGGRYAPFDPISNVVVTAFGPSSPVTYIPSKSQNRMEVIAQAQTHEEKYNPVSHFGQIVGYWWMIVADWPPNTHRILAAGPSRPSHGRRDDLSRYI